MTKDDDDAASAGDAKDVADADVEPAKGSSTDEQSTELGWLDRIIVDPLDDLQRRIKPAGFVVALFKRFSEDRGSQYAALLSYYGFFSLLALLLVLGTLSAMVLAGSPDKQKALIDSITGALPVTGDTVASNVKTLTGSGFALALGLIFVTWSGLGAINNAQDAFNTMWSVPRYEWPNLWIRIARSGAVLGISFVALVVATALGPAISAIGLGWLQIILAGLASLVLVVLALLVTIELLTNKPLGWRAVLPGSIGGGLALMFLQVFGALYMTRVVARAGAFYGTFAAAFGVLVWLSVIARVILMASEVNVVWNKKLFPRSLTGRRLGEPDLRALSDLVSRESMSEELVVESMLTDPLLADPTAAVALSTGTTDVPADEEPQTKGSGEARRRPPA